MRTVIPKGARLIPANAERVFKGVMYDVYHWPQTMFDGSTATFEMLKRQDTIKVIAIKDNKVVLVKDEQPTRGAAFTIPGGRHDIESETELECAKRELLEETGFSFATWKLVEAYQPFDEMDWLGYIFVASDFIGETEQHADGGEKIDVHLMTIEEALRIETATFPSIRRGLEIMRKAGSIEGLLKLPEYTNQ